MTMSTESPRILFLTRKYPPSVGGMETYSKSIYEAFHQSGQDVHLHKPRQEHIGRPTLWQMTTFFSSSCWHLLCYGKRYDAVLIGDYAIASLAVVAKIATFGRIRTVVSLHGNDLYFMRHKSPSAGLYRLLSRIVLGSRALDACIANSGAIQAEADSRKLPHPFVVPLATTVPASPPCHRKAQRTPQLLFTGRLIKYKGIAWFVKEVWPRLDQRYELLVAGQVWDESEHKALIGHPRIRYLGTLAHGDLPAIRASVVACIMPNIPPRATEQDEGFGLVALESPAVGTPIVASACGGIPDAVADGITGYLLPPLDADAWVKRLNEIIDWPEHRREEFSLRAKQHVAEHYNWNLVARRTMCVLNNESTKDNRNV